MGEDIGFWRKYLPLFMDKHKALILVQISSGHFEPTILVSGEKKSQTSNFRRISLEFIFFNFVNPSQIAKQGATVEYPMLHEDIFPRLTL